MLYIDPDLTPGHIFCQVRTCGFGAPEGPLVPPRHYGLWSSSHVHTLHEFRHTFAVRALEASPGGRQRVGQHMVSQPQASHIARPQTQAHEQEEDAGPAALPHIACGDV